MNKKIVLALLLSMITVVSAGCTFDVSFDDKSSDSSASDKETKDDDEKSDDGEKSGFSSMFGSEDEEVTEDATEAPTKEETEEQKEKPTEKETEKSTTKSSDTTASSNVLYDANRVEITYIDTVEEAGYLDFNMSIKNDNDVEIEVQAWEVYVNGIEVDAIMSAPVKPGKTTEDTMGFELEDLEDAGIDPDEIETVEVSFHIFNWDDEIESIDTKLIEFKPYASTSTSTSKDVVEADNGVLYDDNKVHITYIDTTEEYGYLDFNMSIKNDNDVEIEVQAWEVYVNGIEVDAIMSAPVEAGKTTYDDMGFELEELEDAGIDPDEIETIEVSFHIFNWDDEIESIDTELIKFEP